MDPKVVMELMLVLAKAGEGTACPQLQRISAKALKRALPSLAASGPQAIAGAVTRIHKLRGVDPALFRDMTSAFKKSLSMTGSQSGLDPLLEPRTLVEALGSLIEAGEKYKGLFLEVQRYLLVEDRMEAYNTIHWALLIRAVRAAVGQQQREYEQYRQNEQYKPLPASSQTQPPLAAADDLTFLDPPVGRSVTATAAATDKTSGSFQSPPTLPNATLETVRGTIAALIKEHCKYPSPAEYIKHVFSAQNSLGTLRESPELHFYPTDEFESQVGTLLSVKLAENAASIGPATTARLAYALGTTCQHRSARQGARPEREVVERLLHRQLGTPWKGLSTDLRLLEGRVQPTTRKQPATTRKLPATTRSQSATTRLQPATWTADLPKHGLVHGSAGPEQPRSADPPPDERLELDPADLSHMSFSQASRSLVGLVQVYSTDVRLYNALLALMNSHASPGGPASTPPQGGPASSPSQGRPASSSSESGSSSTNIAPVAEVRSDLSRVEALAALQSVEILFHSFGMPPPSSGDSSDKLAASLNSHTASLSELVLTPLTPEAVVTLERTAFPQEYMCSTAVYEEVSSMLAGAGLQFIARGQLPGSSMHADFLILDDQTHPTSTSSNQNEGVGSSSSEQAEAEGSILSNPPRPPPLATCFVDVLNHDDFTATFPIKPLPHVVAKHKQALRLGLRGVVLPAHVWEGLNSRESKRQYLMSKLGLPAGDA
eukprot:gene7692-855_t